MQFKWLVASHCALLLAPIACYLAGGLSGDYAFLWMVLNVAIIQSISADVAFWCVMVERWGAWRLCAGTAVLCGCLWVARWAGRFPRMMDWLEPLVCQTVADGVVLIIGRTAGLRLIVPKAVGRSKSVRAGKQAARPHLSKKEPPSLQFSLASLLAWMTAIGIAFTTLRSACLKSNGAGEFYGYYAEQPVSYAVFSMLTALALLVGLGRTFSLTTGIALACVVIGAAIGEAVSWPYYSHARFLEALPLYGLLACYLVSSALLLRTACYCLVWRSPRRDKMQDRTGVRT